MMVEWTKSESLENRDGITEIENAWGIRFPDDYVQCVLVNDGGGTWPNGVRFGGDSTVFDSLLSFRPPHPWRVKNGDRIGEYYEELTAQNLLPASVYPFAFDPCGNYFAFDYRQSATAPAIIFLNHESLDENGHFETAFIANSFTEMLEQMYNHVEEDEDALRFASE